MKKIKNRKVQIEDNVGSCVTGKLKYIGVIIVAIIAAVILFLTKF